MTFLAVTLCCILCVGTPRAECTDYGDYLHWVSSLNTPGVGFDVAVSGSYAYVADETSGLQVIDLNPTPASSRSPDAVIKAGA
ncbi:hypothetical protein ACFL6M_02135 [Candidatus Eisenbacteria bacterium]|uniref:Uncharacterized protein n=1 Tax=Eiseniibacteriota bacterium TaxID=2212470 RepID=A0ABV6YJM1_UNCEI